MNCKKPNLIYIDRSGEKARTRFILFDKIPEYVERYSWSKELLDSMIEVPCGNCIACRLNYSVEWATRCQMESLCHEHTWFITLSYKDSQLIKGCPTFDYEGNLRLYNNLDKNAISRFIRKLRDHFGHDVNIRYFGCGEYGDGKGERAATLNPHYHIIVFGAPLDDLTEDMPHPDYLTKEHIQNKSYHIFRRKNSFGDFVYWSKTIQDCWCDKDGDPLGKIEVEESTWNTSAYVARYVVKKQKGVGSIVYKMLGVIPEYIRMSNRPGIGYQFMMEHKDSLLRNDYVSVKKGDKVLTIRPPRYFRKMMMREEDSVEFWSMVGNINNRIINAKKRCNDSTSQKSKKQKLTEELLDLESRQKGFIREL